MLSFRNFLQPLSAVTTCKEGTQGLPATGRRAVVRATEQSEQGLAPGSTTCCSAALGPWGWKLAFLTNIYVMLILLVLGLTLRTTTLSH